MNPMLGTDPEVFAVDVNGFVIPAFFALGGDVDLELPHGTAYPDGAAVEFTVTPDQDPAVMAGRVFENLRAIAEFLAANGGLRLSAVSNADIGAYIPQLPESYKRASLQILGCDADSRVYPWTDTQADRPHPREYPFRTLGGHIHVGVEPAIMKDDLGYALVVACLDYGLGTAGTYLADDLPSRDRKKLYGSAGTIRLKYAYSAIEYRVLPAKMLCVDQHIAQVSFAMARACADWAQETMAHRGADYLLKRLGGLNGLARLQEAIDTHDVDACRDMQFNFGADAGDKIAQLVEAFQSAMPVGDTIDA